MLKIEQHTRICAEIPFVHQYRAPFEKVLVTFKGEIKRSIQKWMPGTDKCSQWLALWRYKIFLKRDAFVARQHRLSCANLPITVAYWRRNVCNLVPSWFALAHGTTQTLEGLKEKGFYVVWLKSTCFCAFHLLSHPRHAA
jgi:hypothetical protein